MTDTEIETKGRGTGLAADCTQELLESASNAGSVGASQYFTPHAFGKLCAAPLAPYRATITDLTAGNGSLAIASSNASTTTLLLNDIENVRTKFVEGYPKPSGVRIAGDLGGVFPLMKEVDLRMDCIVLNPPWSLKWKKEAFSKLAESEIETVRRAFTESPGETIDSTILTLMAAFDLCSRRGEGFLIANNDTLQRLIFDANAPFRLLETHIWAHVVLDLNPMTGEAQKTWSKDEKFQCGVIWWAYSHEDGLSEDGKHHCADMDAFAKAAEQIGYSRNRLRSGVAVNSTYHYTEGQETAFKGVRDEWLVRQGKRQADWNIWLTPSGTISTYLSVFDNKNIRIPKDEAKTLFDLSGKRPLQLVTGRNERALLLRHCNGLIWRVDPKLKEAVEDALKEYWSVRSPLMPLGPIQSLGFCDEEDFLMCKADLYEEDLIQKIA